MSMLLTLELLTARQEELLGAWQGELEAVAQRGSGRISANELRQQTREFLELLAVALRTKNTPRLSISPAKSTSAQPRR